MNYGIPYKGSKNTIAGWVVGHFPQKKNFYDLFAGGCAITHRAMLEEKFETYTVNDILGIPELFLDAINGRYRNEKRWISRDDFSRLKDSDLYVRTCWSFGNNGREYLYSREIEPWKKALHFARVLNDFSILESFGIKTDGTRLDIKNYGAEYKEKYIKWYLKSVLKSDADFKKLRENLEEKTKDNSQKLRAYLLDGLAKANKSRADVDRFLGTNGMARHYFGQSQWEFPTREVYTKLQSFLYLPEDYDKIYGLQSLYQRLQSLESLESLQSLQSLERLQRLQSLESLESLQSLQSLECLRGDYRDVKIKPDSLIYCDIPYKDTDGYTKGIFDYESFYDWAEKQTEPVIISEYTMPENRFLCIGKTEKRVTLNITDRNLTKQEKLFVPKAQIKNGIFRIKKFDYTQTELF